VYVISVAAELSGMHPQTLRQYDRLGLVSPGRSSGRSRRYSLRDIAVLREVQRLSQEEGVNLAGIKRILELEAEVDTLRAQVTQLVDELRRMGERVQFAADAEETFRRRYLPVPAEPTASGALVVWRSSRR
jgi:MerR family transcriptional regulator/heat shock protein HspR